MRVLRILFIIIIGCSLIVFVIGTLLYFNQFNGTPSSDQSVWGAFGDYFNMLINLLNLSILSWIGIATLNITREFNEVQITPILDFTVDSPSKHSNYISDSWYLINSSNAAARSISIRFFIGSIFESKWIACYALNGNQRLELPWLRYASRIEVIYGDSLLRNFFQLNYENLNGTVNGIQERLFDIIRISRRLNHANMLLVYNSHANLRVSNNQPIFSNSNDFINNFAIPNQLNA